MGYFKKNDYQPNMILTMKDKIGILLIIIMISSCSINKTSDERRLAFNTFMSKFKPIDLPTTLILEDSTILKESKPIDSNSSDTLFIKPYGNFRTYGYLKDTANYYSLIYVNIGDGLYFRIATFDKGYNKIADTLMVNLDGCIPGTLCLKCNTTINIKDNSTIQTVDSMNYLNCDSLGNSTDSIVNRKQLIQLLSIDKNGRFKIDKE
jgi:hypothetical protein